MKNSLSPELSQYILKGSDIGTIDNSKARNELNEIQRLRGELEQQTLHNEFLEKHIKQLELQIKDQYKQGGK